MTTAHLEAFQEALNANVLFFKAFQDILNFLAYQIEQPYV